MNTMNTMEIPTLKKAETLKDIIENIGAINNEIKLQLTMIADALMDGKHLANDNNNPEDPLTIMDTIRHERDKAEENLKTLIRIRECLW